MLGVSSVGWYDQRLGLRWGLARTGTRPIATPSPPEWLWATLGAICNDFIHSGGKIAMECLSTTQCWMKKWALAGSTLCSCSYQEMRGTACPNGSHNSFGDFCADTFKLLPSHLPGVTDDVVVFFKTWVEGILSVEGWEWCSHAARGF